MPLPISYNVRNVVVRWNSTLITALTIGLAIFILTLSFAIMEGLNEAKRNVASPDNILIMQRGASRFTDSFLSTDTVNSIKASFEKYIKKKDGLLLVAPEIVTLMNTPLVLQPTTQAFVRLRGVNADVVKAQKGIQLMKGSFFKPGLDELMIGKNLVEKYPQQLEIGKKIRLGKNEWTIVGHFNAVGPGYDIEIWADVEQIYAYSRNKTYNAMTLTLQNPADFSQIKDELEGTKGIQPVTAYQLSVFLEQTYYGQRVDEMITGFHVLGILIFTFMAVGAFFTTINTLYGMVNARLREMAVLRTIGFSKFSVYLCFIIESCFITLTGGIIGVLLVLPLNNFSITKWQVLSEVSYNIVMTPKIVFMAVTVSVVLGLIGGFLPAWKASRVKMAAILGK